MSEPTVHIHRKEPLTPPPTYIGECCREWPMAVGYPVGRCGICGEAPTFKRVDPNSTGIPNTEETA